MTIPTPSATIFVGDSFTLTCTAQLDSSVDVAVSVAVVWTGPVEGQFTTTGIMENLLAEDTSHMSTLTVASAMVTDSGDYSCSVTLDSSSNFITSSSSISRVEPVVVGGSDNVGCVLNLDTHTHTRARARARANTHTHTIHNLKNEYGTK